MNARDILRQTTQRLVSEGAEVIVEQPTPETIAARARPTVEQHGSLGPMLALDGITVAAGRADPEDGGYVYVSVNTEDATNPDDHADGVPRITVLLNDATLYDATPLDERETARADLIASGDLIAAADAVELLRDIDDGENTSFPVLSQLADRLRGIGHVLADGHDPRLCGTCDPDPVTVTLDGMNPADLLDMVGDLADVWMRSEGGGPNGGHMIQLRGPRGAVRAIITEAWGPDDAATHLP